MLASATAFCFSAFLMFAAHRCLTFGYLRDRLAAGVLPLSQAAAVGLLSDLWIAVLLSLAYLALRLVGRFFVPQSTLPLLAPVLLLLLGGFLCFHHPYVAFFHVPLIPEHLSYFHDPAFIAASWPSLLEPASWLSAGLFWLLVRLVQHGMPAPERQHPRQQRIFFVVLVFGALLGHVVHIRYKVQWFIPEPLQANVFENLYAQAQLRKTPAALTQAELKRLGNSFHLAAANLRQVVFPARSRASGAGEKPLAAAKNTPESLLASYQAELGALIAAHQKPLILTLLMESLRSSDSAVFGGQAPSLTPHFDALSQQGILFTSAWSTGTVTRSGQEAVWCGYLSALGRSLMRERPELRFRCLPQYVAPGSAFWFHGGEGRFDSQLAFWQRQGVTAVLSQADFAPEVARTGWGVGDLSLVKEAVKRLRALQVSSPAPYLFGMLLTVSNHIPWQLPSDAPDAVKNFAFAGKHPSEATVLYADFALASLVTQLQAAQLWDHCLLVIVGDHGMKAPPLQDYEGLSAPSVAEQASHVPLLLSGGLTTRVLQQQGQTALRRSETVSQADIAAFYAALLAPEALPLMQAEPLLAATKRQRPVLADLGTSVYFPELGFELGLVQALQGPLAGYSEAEQLAVLYYRALLQALTL